MSKFSDAYGDKFSELKKDLLTKSFELGGHTFKVRIPLSIEVDQIQKKFTNPDPVLVDAIYSKMVEPLLKFKDAPTEEAKGVVFTENDVTSDGRSMREAAVNKAMTEIRITEYFKLLIPENTVSNLDDLEYSDIEAEFPMTVQIEIFSKILDSISPSYKETKGN
jgi:hypothetical protein